MLISINEKMICSWQNAFLLKSAKGISVNVYSKKNSKISPENQLSFQLVNFDPSKLWRERASHYSCSCFSEAEFLPYQKFKGFQFSREYFKTCAILRRTYLFIQLVTEVRNMAKYYLFATACPRNLVWKEIIYV